MGEKIIIDINPNFITKPPMFLALNLVPFPPFKKICLHFSQLILPSFQTSSVSILPPLTSCTTIYVILFIKMEETQSHSRQDESDSTANDSNPLEDEVISKPNLLY